MSEDRKPLAIDLLREAMTNWLPKTGEYYQLVWKLIYSLERNGEIRLAAQMRKAFKDIDGKAYKIAAIVMEYETPRLSRHEVKKETNFRFVIEAQSNSNSNYMPHDPQKWLNAIDKEKQAAKLLERSNE